jgi:hypothetical protein
MDLSRDFLLDCFRHIDLSANLRFLNICIEWRNLLLDSHSAASEIKVGQVWEIPKTFDATEAKKGVSGNIDMTNLCCTHGDSVGQSTRWSVAATAWDGRIVLLLESSQETLTWRPFRLMDSHVVAKSLRRLLEVKMLPSTYCLMRRRNDELIKQACIGSDGWMVFFDDCFIASCYRELYHSPAGVDLR